MICNQCPRGCNAERDDVSGKGYCKMPMLPKIARAGVHMWEEPCISGEKGSGTVFFSGCSLGCVFCQNNEISHGGFGKTVTVERLAEIFRELENKGVHNINLVNPTHYVNAIKAAVGIYKPNIPVVYNSGGYDTVAQIKTAASFCDIFLMDMKYRDPARALKYSKAANYPQVNEAAVLAASEAVGENTFDSDGIMKNGLIIRHLVLPQGTRDAAEVVKWVGENAPWAVLSLMSQYTPGGELEGYKELNRKITKREYNKVLEVAAESPVETVFTQRLSSGSTEYIPPFDLSGV